MPMYDEEYWIEQEAYHRMCEQEWERQQDEYFYGLYMREQQMEEERQIQEEMKRYPLFFWRETCEPILSIKEGKEHPKISTAGINIMWW